VVYRLAGKLRLSANYTYRYSWHLSGKNQDQQVAWEPSHIFNLGGYWLQDRGLRAGLAVHGSTERTHMVNQGGEALSARVPVHLADRLVLSGFASYRWESGSGWLEAGLRGQNLLSQPYQDFASMRSRRSDTGYVGGQIIGRMVLFFLRASL